MGNRRLGINELCRGQQEEEGAGSSSDIHSDEPGAPWGDSWQWSRSRSNCVKPGLQNGEEEEGRVQGKESAYGV